MQSQAQGRLGQLYEAHAVEATRFAYFLTNDLPTADCGNARIFKIGLAQDDPEALTRGPADYHPAWSPDGTQIAFTRDLDNIFLMSPTGAGDVQITEVPENYEPGGLPMET